MKNTFRFWVILGITSLAWCQCQKSPIEDSPQTGTHTGSEPEFREILYTLPDENTPHEGTWLQWPHEYQYGTAYRNHLEKTWVDMTRELVQSEKVHIIAYNSAVKNRIVKKLNAAGISLTNVDFRIFKTNDVWVRDNGPLFVQHNNGQWHIEDWGFNGWGFDFPYAKDNIIPTSVANALAMPVVNLNTTMILEGGAIEVDGAGILMATRSAILEPDRNPGMTQAQAESILNTYLGVTDFIWLDGAPGGNEDVTDMHIDGFARFLNPDTIVSMNDADLSYWGLSQADIIALHSAVNANNQVYHFVELPLTQNDVVTAYGLNLGYKGSYVNYYVTNSKVLVPNYNDPNDAVANALIQSWFPAKTIVGIDCRNLYREGGMVHCVVMQQPQF